MFQADGVGIEECGQNEIRSWDAISAVLVGRVKDRPGLCLLVNEMDGTVLQPDDETFRPVGFDADCLVNGRGKLNAGKFLEPALAVILMADDDGVRRTAAGRYTR